MREGDDRQDETRAWTTLYLSGTVRFTMCQILLKDWWAESFQYCAYLSSDRIFATLRKNLRGRIRDV